MSMNLLIYLFFFWLQNRLEKDSKKSLWINIRKEDYDTPCQENKLVIMVSTKTFRIQHPPQQRKLL